MVMVIKNKIKNKYKVVSFQPSHETFEYFKKCKGSSPSSYNKSKFINKAISFYILLIENPKQIMMELKRRYPALWKSVNRRKF